MGRPLTYDHLVGKKKPLTKTIAVVLDPQLAEEYEAARSARDMAKYRADARPADSEAAMALLEADAALEAVRNRLDDEEAIAEFRFRGIGRAAYEALVDKHPPTAEQRMKAKASGFENIAWNPDTFPPALVAACLIEPDLAYEDVLGLWRSDDWNQAELQELLNAAIAVNGTRRTVELGKDSRPTPISGHRSPTA